MSYTEVNFDGLIGPTHNYAGLAVGNLASQKHVNQVSHPKQAALQGLEKMQTLLGLGYKQGFFPPQQRPRLDILRNLGFSGDDTTLLQSAHKQSPDLLAMVYSASPMWAANAATVTPSPDSHDQRVHLTPANLLTTAHRAIEHNETWHCLQTAFSNNDYFSVHKPLLAHSNFADEGAANHNRLCEDYGQTGVGLFVYGRDGQQQTKRFPARQTLRASEAIARAHTTKHPLFLKQNPEAIDAGAFHNDVVAVSNGPVLFFHEDAFDQQQQNAQFDQLSNHLPFQAVKVPRDKVSLSSAVSSYLFNSQLLASPDGDMSNMLLVSPLECRESVEVKRYMDELLADNTQPIRQVKYVDVRQSMSNGGGPACLRLRVVLNEQEYQAVNPAFLLCDEKIEQLKQWVSKHYRDELSASDLADPDFLRECYETLDALTELLGIENYYAFQHTQ